MYVPAVTPGFHCYNHKCSSNFVSDIFREEVQYTKEHLEPSSWFYVLKQFPSILQVTSFYPRLLVCKYEHSCASTGQMMWGKAFHLPMCLDEDDPCSSTVKNQTWYIFFFLLKSDLIYEMKKRQLFADFGIQTACLKNFCGFKLAWVKEHVFDFGLYLNTNTLHGFSCWVHHSGEWADKTDCGHWPHVLGVWAGQVHCVCVWGGGCGGALSMWEAASCGPLSLWDLWISAFQSALSVKYQPLQRLLLTLSWGS